MTNANTTLYANAEAAHRLAVTAEHALKRLNDELERDFHELTEATLASAHFQSLRMDLRADLAELARLREHLFRIGLLAEENNHGRTRAEAVRDAEEKNQQAAGILHLLEHRQ